MNVNNFTEFYSLLKNNDAITNTIPHLRDFVVLAETYRDMCSCDRKSEKLRLKTECESQYRILVTTVVAANINVFFAVLKQSHLRFIYNCAVIREFSQ